MQYITDPRLTSFFLVCQPTSSKPGTQAENHLDLLILPLQTYGLIVQNWVEIVTTNRACQVMCLTIVCRHGLKFTNRSHFMLHS